MPNKSDKSLVRNMILFCIGTVLLFHLAWAHNYFINLGNWLFAIVDIALLILFAYQANSAYKYADDPNKDWKRYVIIGLALLSSIWAAAWSAGLNEGIHL
jgi:predicted membrane chloride channel (bestrophin family)